MKISIKDTTRKEREEIIRRSLDCGGGGCENCCSCCLGGGNTYKMYQDYIDGKRKYPRSMQSTVQNICMVDRRHISP